MRSTRLAVCAVKLDLHVVQLNDPLLQLHLLRSVNLVLRVRAQRMGIGDPVGLLLDVDPQPLGQLLAD